MLNQGMPLYRAADASGMCENTARKYLRTGKDPQELAKKHTWRTREDHFTEDWDYILELLDTNPGLQSKTIFKHLQEKYPGKYQDGQLRTLQRKVKQWRVESGKSKEVYFPQTHHPGKLGQSDFTHMGKLGITIQGEEFDHLLYHFVLTYSNWETGIICSSESYESLSEGFQSALWELGCVPERHRTDCLSAAVNKRGSKEEFTNRYSALLRHYGVKKERTQPRHPNENGDVEQSHNRFKQALNQALMLRGSRDFQSQQEYEEYLRKLFTQLNQNRMEKFQEEIKVMKSLPPKRLDSTTELEIRVSKHSTINIKGNVYSVKSCLIKEKVRVKLFFDHLEVWYGQKQMDILPRLYGRKKHHINYHHIIEGLARKPGAFENYRYREELFPTSYFRMAYDKLVSQNEVRADKEYVKILLLASRESEERVNNALKHLLNSETPINHESVIRLVKESKQEPDSYETNVSDTDLEIYNGLHSDWEVH